MPSVGSILYFRGTTKDASILNNFSIIPLVGLWSWFVSLRVRDPWALDLNCHHWFPV
jgi:hypothetical protein